MQAFLPESGEDLTETEGKAGECWTHGRAFHLHVTITLQIVIISPGIWSWYLRTVAFRMHRQQGPTV